MTDRERRYRSTSKGRAWVLRSAEQQTRKGKHAEAQARYARRKAEEHDEQRQKELVSWLG